MPLNIKIVHTTEYFVQKIWWDNKKSLPLHSFLKVVQKSKILYTLSYG